MMPTAVTRLPVFGDAGLHEIAVFTDGHKMSHRRVLCLPGILETREGFRGLIQQALETRIFTFDFAGRGDSDYLQGSSSYRMSGCLRDACSAYSYVLGGTVFADDSPATQTRQPREAGSSDEPYVHLVGNSMGGLIGIFLAGQRPTGLSSVVINDVSCLLPWASLFTLFGALSGFSFASSVPQRLSGGSRPLAETLNVDKKLIPAILQPAYLDLPHVREISGLSFLEAFRAVDVPVLVLYSADSPIFTAAARKAMNYLPSTYSFMEVEGNTHPVAYSEEVTGAILQFMETAETSGKPAFGRKISVM